MSLAVEGGLPVSQFHFCPPLPIWPSWNSIPFHIKDLEMLPDRLYQGTAASLGPGKDQMVPSHHILGSWKIATLIISLDYMWDCPEISQTPKWVSFTSPVYAHTNTHPETHTQIHTQRHTHTSSRKPQIAPVLSLGSCTITPNDSFDEQQQTFPGVISGPPKSRRGSGYIID